MDDYHRAIDLLDAARNSGRGRNTRIMSAQGILLERMISPAGGGLGQHLVQFHEHLYDRLSYAHLLKDRSALDEVLWSLRELCELCSRMEAAG